MSSITSKLAYEILEISPESSLVQIKKAFRKLALRYHPDKNNNHDESSDNFRQINKAHDFLVDLISTTKTESRNEQYQQLPPNQYQLQLSLEEIFHGCTRNEKINRKIIGQDGVERIEGKILEIIIKPGILSGCKLTFYKEGDQVHGKIPANVVFEIEELPHTLFKRFRFNLEYTAKISLNETLKEEIFIPTLERTDPLNVKIDQIITNNTVLKIPNQGLPVYNAKMKRGDLVVRFEVICGEVDPQKNFSKEYNLFLTLEQIFFGCKKKIKLDHKIIDSDGNEKTEKKIIFVDIKPGILFGEKISLCQNNPDSNCYEIKIVVQERPHVYFDRNGANLTFTAYISQSQLGTQYKIPVLGNKNLTIFIDEDILFGSCTKTFSGYGLPFYEDPNKFGDLFVNFCITKNDLVDPPIRRNLLLSLKNICHGCFMTIKIGAGISKGIEICFPRSGDRHGSIPNDIIFVVDEKNQDIFS